MNRLLMTFFMAMLTLGTLIGCSSSDTVSENKKADIYYSHGTQAMMNKDYATALDMLMKAQKLDPKNAKILNNLGMAYFFKGDTPLAMKWLSEAIQINPQNSDARNNVASLLYSQGKIAEAKKHWEIVKSDLVYQHQYRTYYNLSLISDKEGNTHEALALLERSLKEKSDYCPAHFKKGEINFKRQKYKDALESFKESGLGECYNYPDPVYRQGLALVKMRDYPRAIQKFKELAQRFKKTEYYNLALVQLQQLEKATPENNRNLQLSRKSDSVTQKRSSPVRQKSKKSTDDDLENEMELYESPDF